MATEEEAESASQLDEVVEDIRRELVHRVAATDRESNRDIYDALETEYPGFTVRTSSPTPVNLLSLSCWLWRRHAGFQLAIDYLRWHEFGCTRTQVKSPVVRSSNESKGIAFNR